VTGREFHAHEHVLAQSPVLMRICQNHKHSLLRLILPDDIGDRELCRVLEYLYSGKLAVATHDFYQGTLSIVHELTELYLFASRLGLGRLMELIVRELEKHDFLKSNPTVLFLTAERIYSATPKSDRTFKDFFIAALTSCYENCEEFPDDHAAKLLTAGGTLAVDIYQAQGVICQTRRVAIIDLKAEIRGVFHWVWIHDTNVQANES